MDEGRREGGKEESFGGRDGGLGDEEGDGDSACGEVGCEGDEREKVAHAGGGDDENARVAGDWLRIGRHGDDG